MLNHRYGWHSEPRQYSSIEFDRRPSRSNYAQGPRRGSIDKASGGQRRSIDLSNMSHSNGLQNGSRSGSGRNSRNGGAGHRNGNISSGSSSSGDHNLDRSNSSCWHSRTLQQQQQQRSTAHSPLALAMKHLDVNAREFRPTWESGPAFASSPLTSSGCGAHLNTSSVMGTAAV